MGDFFAELRRRHIYGASVICAVVVCLGPQGQTASAQIPIFAPDPYTAWNPNRPDGDNYLPPESGPGPVVSHPDHPYRPNGPGDDTSSDPTYRVADLSNPILTPWAIEQMQPWNDMVQAGKNSLLSRREMLFAGRSGVEYLPQCGVANDLFRADTRKSSDDLSQRQYCQTGLSECATHTESSADMARRIGRPL